MGTTRARCPGWRAQALPRSACALALLSCALAWGGTSNAAPAAASAPEHVFLFAEDSSSGTASSYGPRLFTLLYGEAFRRLKLPVRFELFPAARVTLMVESGQADGVTARAQYFAQAHPKLLRLDESVHEAVFNLYALDPKIQPKQLSELAGTDWRVDYRNGVLYCEHMLRPWVPAARMNAAVTVELALRRLALKRTELYCEVDIAINNVLYRQPAVAGAEGLRAVMQLGEPTPLYGFLHPRHAQLAVQLTAVLKQMKREGLFELYRQRVLMELGAH